MSTGREIRLIREDEGDWSAIGEGTDVASQGETRQEALTNLHEAIELTLKAHEADTDAPWFEG